MSGDPKRLLERGSGATEAERDLLRVVADVEPDSRARAATWAALAARSAPVAGGGGTAGGAAGGASPAGGATIGAKTVAAGLIGAAIAVGTVLLIRPSRDSQPAPSLASASVSVPVAPAREASESPELPAEPATTPTATQPRPSHPVGSRSTETGATSSTDADALRDEIALVAAARSALRQGDGVGALASLELARKRHPRGGLIQEREVLTIEALAQSGDATGASRRATAFLRAFPASPHAAHVRTFER